jgi:regulator of sirC expression with transglutaminase-like and TPR domain
MLAHVIGMEFGFAGARETYDAPDNSDLIRVMDRRRGLPLSLTILYVSAARRMGWQASAIDTPSHVLARVGPEVEPVLIDPFRGGAVVDAQTLATLLRAALGRRATPGPEHLCPMSNRSVLVRLLLNQASVAESLGDGRRALTLFERMTTIAPSNSHIWWERARLQLIDGDFAGARSSLSDMLEVTRDPALRAHIGVALDGLSRSTG